MYFIVSSYVCSFRRPSTVSYCIPLLHDIVNLLSCTLGCPDSTPLTYESRTPGSSELRYLTLLIEPRGEQILLGHPVCTSDASLVPALDLLKFLVQPRSARWPRIREEPTAFQIGFHHLLVSRFHKGCSTTEHGLFTVTS